MDNLAWNLREMASEKIREIALELEQAMDRFDNNDQTIEFSLVLDMNPEEVSQLIDLIFMNTRLIDKLHGPRAKYILKILEAGGQSFSKKIILKRFDGIIPDKRIKSFLFR